MQTDEHADVDLGVVLSQSKTNSEQIRVLGDRLDSFAKDVRDAIENLSSRIGRAQKTDWVAVFAGVSLVIAMLSPILYFLYERSHELDSKLQKEFSLALETTKERSEALATASKERHDADVAALAVVREEVNSLRQWMRDRTAADLEELRLRRMGKP